MKHTLTTYSIFLFTSLTVLSVAANAQDSGNKTRLNAMLILASNDGTQSDSRVGKYEPRLRKLFKFNSYRRLGEGSASLSLPGTAKIGLGGGYSLHIEADPASGAKIRAKVKWRRERTVLINTTVMMQRGTPTVLGGPSHADGTLIVILTLR